MLTEIQELIVGLLEKHPLMQACKETHDQLTKKFGQGWNVIIGKDYANNVGAVKGTVLQMYYQGVYGIDIWKAER